MRTFKEAIKAIGDKIAIGALAIGIAVLGAVPPSAWASVYSQNLGITNWLSGTNQIIGYPTNSVNPTNGVPMNNGHAVRVDNVDSYGLTLTGFFVTSNQVAGNVLSFMLVGSTISGQPAVTLGTNVFTANGTNMVGCDFISTNQLLGPIFVPLPLAYTNWFNWSTNISSFANVSWLPQASWIGVYAISNTISGGALGAAQGSFMSNVTLSVQYKLKPTPLIGQ